jgi:hypothetical protein
MYVLVENGKHGKVQQTNTSLQVKNQKLHTDYIAGQI